MRREQQKHTDVDPSAPTTLAGALSAGPPPGSAGPKLTNLGPSHASYGSNEVKETRRTSRPTRNSGFTAGRGFNPSGGAPGGG
ncbi:hypothetical protein F511_26788 [Dorcoceras hygrometricum]|uniref:Uncharacterized protein n=1 Tax=Dorcoceras hygrometricum TaxID=472368 RepID=A0A2Z7AC69_9LAMI|nr:hypothetical protein F511_26788 [Dorcoceras hygrometricum]